MSAGKDKKSAGVVLLGVGLLLVFTVPYLFPHGDGISQSYMVHYSNRVALLLILLWALLLGWRTEVLGLRYVSAEFPGASRRPMFLVAVISMALVGLLWVLERRLGATGEASYFLDRYGQQELGLRLYRDLEFSYGPLMFWPQRWLGGVGGFGMGAAHFAVLMVSWPLGLALLWYLCGRLAPSRRAALISFLLLSGIWGNAIVDGGLNYTPLRFLPGPALALWMWDRWHSGRPELETLSFGLAGFLGLLFYSPEQGIAFAAATALFFGGLSRPRAGMLPLAAFAGSCVAGLAVAWHLGVLNTLLSIGGGSLDLPILPSARIILLLCAVMLGGGLATRAVLRGEGDRREVYLALICVGLLPAALGRADPGHIFINELPLIAVVYFALARTAAGLRFGTIALGGYLLVAGALHDGLFAKAMRWQWRHPANRTAVAEPVDRKLLAPFGYPQDFLERKPLDVVTGRYATYLPLLNAQEPATKVRELEESPAVALVVPSYWRDLCTISATNGYLELKGALRPWFYPPVRAKGEPDVRLCAYISQHYETTQDASPHGGYIVLAPR